MKRMVNRNKKSRLKNLVNTKQKTKSHEVTKISAQILKLTGEQRVANGGMNPASFTAHMSTKPAEAYSPPIEPFTTDEKFIEYVQRAIKRAPIGKSVGTDGLFVECFKLAPKLIAEIFSTIWRKCSSQKFILTDWKTAVLTPIYKKGDVADPKNYRPIAVLSHARKMVDAAIAMAIREKYTFNPLQLGFQPGTSTESAIVRHLDAAKNMPVTAILDLRAAYDSVPRKLMWEIIEERLDPNLAKMGAMALQPLEGKTKHDQTDQKAEVEIGVPQGSPLSPTLFNIFMDTYAEAITEKMNTSNEPDSQRWACCLFADDVKLQACSREAMKQLLDISEKWARKMGMCWSPKKCHILTRSSVDCSQLTLEGESIETKHEALYLGMSATATGLSATSNIKRVQNARNCLAKLRKELTLEKGITYSILSTVCRTLLLPLARYGIHLCPQTQMLKKEWEMLERDILYSSLGWYSDSKRNRLQKMIRLKSFEQWTEIQLENL